MSTDRLAAPRRMEERSECIATVGAPRFTQSKRDVRCNNRVGSREQRVDLMFSDMERRGTELWKKEVLAV